MEKPTESNCSAVQIIENEGIGYAIQSYINADAFIDPKTRELWQNARDALDNLEEYLKEQVGEDYENCEDY